MADSQGAPLVLFFLVGVALLGLTWWLNEIARKAEEARQRQIFDLAESLGFEFFPGGVPETGGLFGSSGDARVSRFLAQFQGLHPFDEGHSPRVVYALVGDRDGTHWMLFEYEYRVTRSDGKRTTTTTYHHTIVAAQCPVYLPEMVLAEENLFTKLGSVFAGRDLQFESEEFNQRYHVKGEDERGIYDVLHPQMMEYLLGLPTQSWQIRGPLIVHTYARRMDPSLLAGLMAPIEGFIERIPAFVREDRGWTPTPSGESS